MHPLLLSFYHIFYPLKEPPALTRERPLRILCLGISRSGTDSLRTALLDLGYSNVHHGHRFLERPGEILQWLRIAHLRHTLRVESLDAEEFDKCLADCEAVTDSASVFGHQLLTAYPDAKVVLNYREDVDAWHASVKRTIGMLDTSWLVWLFYFQTELFWSRQAVLYMWRRCYQQYGGSFDQVGKQWYRQHYASLEQRLKEEGRLYLKWKVQDGWEPLCKHLDKPVPKRPFPSGNTAEDFQRKIDAVNNRRLAEAKRNVLFVLACLLLFLAAAYVWVGRRF